MKRLRVLIATGLMALAFVAGVRPTRVDAAPGSLASISSVNFGGTLPGGPIVTVNGSGFGTIAPSPNRAGNPCPTNSGFYYGPSFTLMDLTGRWNAGNYVPDQQHTYYAIIIDAWSDTQVQFHFDGCWTFKGRGLYPGDAVTVVVAGVSMNMVVPDPAADSAAGIKSPGTYYLPDFPAAPAGGWSSTSVDVKVTRLADASASYYYAEQWSMETPGTEGGLVPAYMGIQTLGNPAPDEFDEPTALVSIFTNDIATSDIAPGVGPDGLPATCYGVPVSGEGSYATCRVRFAWQPEHLYQYRFALTGTRQWTATITDRSASGSPVTTLGTFTVPSNWLGIHEVDAGFLEQYGAPPETSSSATHPVCPLPAHRTTVQFLDARLNDTVAPTAEHTSQHVLNDVGTHLVCQNASGTLVTGGVQLDMDLPTPAPVSDARAQRAGTSVTISWTPPRDPVTVTRAELANAMFSAPKLQALTTIALPTPTSYTVTVSPGSRNITVPASTHRATFTGLQPGRTYRFSITSDRGDARSGSVTTTAEIPSAPRTSASGYRLVDSNGTVYPFGSAHSYGNAALVDVVHLESTPSGAGYWIVNRAGKVAPFGDAARLGDATALRAGEYVSTMSATPTGHGYWLFTNQGRVERFGDAQFFGDMSGSQLNGSIVGSVTTPTGKGYYLVAQDGGVFAFGDARFRGSMGGRALNRPVEALVPSADNDGYWLVASDGGIFAFGSAPFRGSTGALTLNQPIVGMVRYGNGYLMVASDGGIFDFSNIPFAGSLGGTKIAAPIVSIASNT